MMKACLVCSLVIGVALMCSGQAVAPQKSSAVAVLADGTPVKLKVPSTFNAAAVHVGDAVELLVLAPVIIAGETVISTENVASAVVSSQRTGLTKKEANKVEINLRFVSLVDGERVLLRLQLDHQPGQASESVTSSGVGQDFPITGGAELTAYIVGNLTLDLSRLHSASQPASEIRIISTPATAEVSIDGRTVGVAPYTAHVTRGEHDVVVRASGYAPFHKTVVVTDHPADIEVQLQKQDNTEPIPQQKAATASIADLARQARARKAAQEAQKSADAAGSNTTPPAPSSQN